MKFVNFSDITVTNIPKQFDGPELQDSLWRSVLEIIENLPLQNPVERERIELGLEMFERGLQEYNKDTRRSEAFLFYWFAMEILCGGEGKVEGVLQNHYRFKDRARVQTLLGTPSIRAWRNNTVHHGKKPQVMPDVERYLQLMFIDICRAKLNLPCNNLALSFAAAGGVNLSSLGLKDNSDPNSKYTVIVKCQPANNEHP